MKNSTTCFGETETQASKNEPDRSQQNRQNEEALAAHNSEDIKELNMLDDKQWDALFQIPFVSTVGAMPIWTRGIFKYFAESGEDALLAHKVNETSQLLCALMPMSLQSWASGYPGAVLKTKSSDFTLSGTPLIHRDNPTQAFLRLIRNAKLKYGANAIIFNNCSGDGTFIKLLEEIAAFGLQWHILERRERAILFCEKDFDSWYGEAIPKKRRKEYRRLRNRLAEQGKLVSETRMADEPIEPWIEQFLLLEAAGWKGGRGTAIASTATSTAFFREILPQLSQRGELMFWRLTLDGKPLAMLFALISNDRAWLVKIAYDEHYQRYSPGVLIILDATQWFLETGKFFMVDSCAQPNHPMIDHLWRDRLKLADLIISTPETSRIKFAAFIKIEQLRRGIRRTAKSAFYKITGRRAV